MRLPVFTSLTCGGCGQGFRADMATVPMFPTPKSASLAQVTGLVDSNGKRPCCQPCWDRRNRLRKAIGLGTQDRPPAYPGDYAEEGSDAAAMV